MPTEPQPTTLAEVVNRAVNVADPDNQDPAIASLQELFEDADEPVSAVLDSLEEGDPPGTVEAWLAERGVSA